MSLTYLRIGRKKQMSAMVDVGALRIKITSACFPKKAVPFFLTSVVIPSCTPAHLSTHLHINNPPFVSLPSANNTYFPNSSAIFSSISTTPFFLSFLSLLYFTLLYFTFSSFSLFCFLLDRSDQIRSVGYINLPLKPPPRDQAG